MKTPKILPWLARKAGIAEARANELWTEAIHHATDKTGWVGTPEYWKAAMDRLLELIEIERTTPKEEPVQTARPPELGRWSFLRIAQSKIDNLGPGKSFVAQVSSQLGSAINDSVGLSLRFSR